MHLIHKNADQQSQHQNSQSAFHRLGQRCQIKFLRRLGDQADT